ncbi:hypothetical protein CLD22_15735 [Rubrivivax gelatinosus]|nr:hypothetical protein [Rubrivivax gelatinosus]
MNESSATLRLGSAIVFAFAACAGLGVALTASQIPRSVALLLALANVLGAACALGTLWWTTRSLRRTRTQLVAQIEAAGLGRFEERVQSGAAEWVPVSRALNVAMVRLAAQMADRDRRLGELQAEVSVDELTGLAARAQFIDRLNGMLNEGAAEAGGALVLLRVDDLGGLNQRIGRERTDALLRAVATLLRTRALQLAREGAVVARLNGADFAVAAPGVSVQQLDDWTRDLAAALHGLRQRQLSDRHRVGWVASSVFHVGETPGAVLSRVDNALQAGEAANKPWLTVRAHRKAQPSMAQWRVLIDDALATGRVELDTEAVCGPDGMARHRLAQLRLCSQDGRVFGDDVVLPAALHTGRTADLDLHAAQLALAAIAAGGGSIALKISARSAERPGFVSRLQTAVAEAGEHASGLWLEIDIGAETEPLAVLAPLAAALAPHRVRLGLDHVHNLPERLTALRRLGLSYLRLAPAMTSALSGDGGSGKRLMLQLVGEVCVAEGLELLAGPAADAADAELLRELGVPCACPLSGHRDGLI